MENKNALASDQAVDCTFFGIANQDMPIYRIFPLWFFEQALRTKSLTLAAPKLWEDKYEILGNAIAVNYLDNGHNKQAIINQDLPPVYAQCWSATPESDTLLRAYSRVVKDPLARRNTCPRDEGVRVKTTPRKLMAALVANTHLTAQGRWFMGAVLYRKTETIYNHVGTTIQKHGLEAYADPVNRAILLLLKRAAFSHENELRVLFVCNDKTLSTDVLTANIDPNAVFEEATFDPRLEQFEKNERKDTALSLGFKGAIKESSFYQRPLLVIDIGAMKP